MLLHHTERSGLASRCLNVDRLAFCRMYVLKIRKDEITKIRILQRSWPNARKVLYNGTWVNPTVAHSFKQFSLYSLAFLTIGHVVSLHLYPYTGKYEQQLFN